MKRRVRQMVSCPIQGSMDTDCSPASHEQMSHAKCLCGLLYLAAATLRLSAYAKGLRLNLFSAMSDCIHHGITVLVLLLLLPLTCYWAV